MSTHFDAPIATAIQLCSQSDIALNLQTTQSLIEQAANTGSQIMVLPENFAYMGNNQPKTAEQFDEISQQVATWAAQYAVWIVAGSIPCPYRPDGSKVANHKVRSASLLFDAAGQLNARYDKIHLFDAVTHDGTVYQESATFEPGNQPVVAHTPFGNMGLMVCYDLRFATLALRLRQLGADIITAPSAFTYLTGQVHWQLLCQARALDSQCFVIAANQVGTHHITPQTQRQTWGHSCIVHANGSLLAMSNSNQIDIVQATLTSQEQQVLRKNLPTLTHTQVGYRC